MSAHFAIPVCQHFTGRILATLKRAVAGTEVTISNRQANGSYGIYQAHVRLEGDDTDYRLLLMPADAPIAVNGLPVDHHFVGELAA